ncbi:ABC transporter substrate-binding protein [Chitinimonas arctica]|nr:ABC transporter substrate-binding protein [Chitinimonas arctica]
MPQLIGCCRAAMLGLLLLGTTAHAAALRVGYLPNIGFAPLDIAESKGYWKELGVQVQLVPFADSHSQMKALAEGNIDVAGDLTANFVGWAMEGAPIKLTAETHTSNGSVKILLKSGLEVTRLNGQALGVGEKQVGQLFLVSRYLSANGRQLSDFKIQESTPEKLTANFGKGQLPIVVLPDPQALFIYRTAGAVIGADSATYPGLVTEGFAANNKSLVSIPDEQWIRFYRGWIKAVAVLRGGNMKWSEFRGGLDSVVYQGFLVEGEASTMGALASIKFPNNAEALKRHGNLGGLEYHVRAVLRFMREAGLSKTEPEARSLIQSTAFERALAASK